jgi:hypothetical protein
MKSAARFLHAPPSGRPLAAALVGMLSVFLLLGCGASYTVRLSAADIEQAMARRLPISKSKLLVAVTVRSVFVEFMLDEDKILLQPQVDLRVAGQTALSGRALLEGQLRYARETGEFFIDQPKVVQVFIQGLPEAARAVTEEVIARLGESALASTPVYRLNPSDFKQSVAKLVLKSVKVRQGRLEIELGT